MSTPPDPRATETLDGVVDLFWRRGYHDVCVEDIVHSTGLNRHTLYGSYGSKLGLFRAALDHYACRDLAELDAVLLGPGTPLQRLHTLMSLREQERHAFWGEVRRRGCLASRSATELGQQHPELRQPMDTIGQHLRMRIEELVRQAQGEGELRANLDPAQAAAIITACFIAPLAWEGAARENREVLAILA